MEFNLQIFISSLWVWFQDRDKFTIEVEKLR